MASRTQSRASRKPPSARKGVADEVATSLRKAIVKGRFQPGDPLPSERELADRFEVNRSSVREALTRLEAWGLVKIRHGGATRVRDFLLNAGLELLPHLVEPGGAVDRGILGDLHELRAMILGWSAEQAALKADAASLARLEALVRQMGAPKVTPATLQKLDYDFFEELVRIGGNRLLALFSNAVRDVYQRGRERFLGIYAPGIFDVRHHRKAVKAIRARDPATAGQAMRAHALSALRTLGGDS